MGAYFTVTVENDYYNGYIKISSTQSGTMPSGTVSVRVKKKKNVDHVYSTIFEKNISSVGDFTFQIFDHAVASGVSYDYLIVPVIDEIENVGEAFEGIQCSFDGVRFYDAETDEEYVCRANISLTGITNKATVAYVQPLSSKYPHAIRNCSADYYIGSFSGLFSDFDSDTCAFLIKAGTNQEIMNYKMKVADFLSNGNIKLMRTYDGIKMMVSIDGDVKIDGNEIDSNISFNFTEIDDVPESLLSYPI